VRLDDIDPVYYERTYWLAPTGEGAGHAYRLLEAAMEECQRVGIGTVVMRNKQYLAAIRPLHGALAMSAMRFADEVVARSDIDELPPGKAKLEAKELRLPARIIDSLAAEWEPDRYHDTYSEQLSELIAKKAKGEELVVEEAPDTGSNVIDLMQALEASLEAAKKAGGDNVKAEVARVAEGIRNEADNPPVDDKDDDRSATRPTSRSGKRSTGGRARRGKATGPKMLGANAPARKTSAAKRSPARRSG
jgi:DNA end-binding protein Ku